MLQRVHTRQAGLAVATALGLVTVWLFSGTTNVGAHEGPDEPEGPFEVVAAGLENPRGLAFGPDGTLYVAEAGRGGNGPCVPPLDVPPEEGQVPEEAEAPPAEEGPCYGSTGAITRIKDGQQRELSGAYPSLAEPDGSFASGPHDVSVDDDGTIYTIVGLGANPADRAILAGEQERVWVFGSLIQVDHDGSWEVLKDVSNYELFHNPDGEAIDSNPYSVLALKDKRLVVDAGGNSLLEVLPDGTINTLAVFSTRDVARPEELPAEAFPDQIPMESVPTSVVQGPDGAYYVGELTGFPFPPGEARVYRVLPGEEPEVYADGLTNVIDLAFGDDGTLYVLEITKNGLLAAEQAVAEGGDLAEAAQGALIRIKEDGTHEEIASEGLIAPAGLAIGHDGAFYIANCGICAGDGQVVRLEAEPTPASTPEGSSGGADMTGTGGEMQAMAMLRRSLEKMATVESGLSHSDIKVTLPLEVLSWAGISGEATTSDGTVTIRGTTDSSLANNGNVWTRAKVDTGLHQLMMEAIILPPDDVYLKRQGEDTWLKLESEALRRVAQSALRFIGGGSAIASPFLMDLEIHEAINAAIVGHESFQGFETTHIEMRLDFQELWAQVSEDQQEQLIAQILPPMVELDPEQLEGLVERLEIDTIQVWIDEEGFLRKSLVELSVGKEASVQIISSYREFNADLDVRAPSDFRVVEPEEVIPTIEVPTF